MIVNAYEFMSDDNVALWLEHLWKLVAECVMVIAMPEAFVQFGTEGVMHNMPQASPMQTAGQVTPDLKSVKWVMDKKIMDRIDPLLISLKNWICYKRTINTGIYAKYPVQCGCENDNTRQSRKTDIVLGLYDEEDVDCCRSVHTDAIPSDALTTENNQYIAV
jgi:hypothetical protein